MAQYLLNDNARISGLRTRMRRIFQNIAVASLTLISGMAAAQSSVTVYGNIDLGLLTQNHAPSGRTTTKMIRLNPFAGASAHTCDKEAAS